MAIHNESELETYICEYLEQHGWLLQRLLQVQHESGLVVPDPATQGGEGALESRAAVVGKLVRRLGGERRRDGGVLHLEAQLQRAIHGDLPVAEVLRSEDLGEPGVVLGLGVEVPVDVQHALAVRLGQLLVLRAHVAAQLGEERAGVDQLHPAATSALQTDSFQPPTRHTRLWNRDRLFSG